MNGTYQTGNTVRLSATFRDIQEKLVDPDLVKIIIYNVKYEKIEEYLLDSIRKISKGNYVLDYRLPDKPLTIYYEWYGEISGNPFLRREKIITKFI